jgi:hypothetical protein
MQTSPRNSLDLPAPIAGYFTNETTDSQVVARCFT